MKRTLFLALLLATPAAAQPPSEAEYRDTTGRAKPVPVIPRELGAIVIEARPHELIVRGLAGQRIAVALDWEEPDRFRTFYDGRYLGFSFTGYETFGFILVDRAAEGAVAVIEAGAAPNFSPNGRFFAAAQVSGAGFGNLEGVALWSIEPNRTVRRFFSEALPPAQDWRVDGWARANCVLLSVVDFNWQPPDGRDWESALPEAPRLHYRLEVGDGVSLLASGDTEGCRADDRGVEG